MRIACAFDHAGVSLRDLVIETLRAAGHEPIDLGTDDDYPDTARKAGIAIRDGVAERAIIVCGSGAGVSVAASKFAGIRAAVGHETYTAHQCVEHDDCNVLCLGARVIGPAIAAEVVSAFAGARFSGEKRHVRRLNKIARIEAEETERP
ncbi:MAG TPA: RpiB/LacA/LacB family sugar-phosphate isomerase [Solirubrobacteraceae bacterium]|nr:RpiB/LacA/LacB family sugar-phosphate isomerase [Solirubrobacteraceae bacterium]